MTHTDLVERALKWLTASRGCYFAFAEKGYRNEAPDAIGWIGGWSVLVECKASRSDFYRDRRKRSRIDGAGMGQERYYLTPPRLLKADMIPEGWGLIEAWKRIRFIVRLPKGGPRYKLNPICLINEVGFLVNHWGHEPDAKRE